MRWLNLFKRTSRPIEEAKGNRTLTAEEIEARDRQAALDAERANQEAENSEPNNPNRLRTSEEFRKEQRDKKQERAEKLRSENQIGGLIREVISGQILAREAMVRQVPFFMYVSFLTILYLALGYQTERILREKQKTEAQLEEAIATEKSLRSTFEFEMQQSKLIESTEVLGLEQPTVPPILLSAEE